MIRILLVAASVLAIAANSNAGPLRDRLFGQRAQCANGSCSQGEATFAYTAAVEAPKPLSTVIIFFAKRHVEDGVQIAFVEAPASERESVTRKFSKAGYEVYSGPPATPTELAELLKPPLRPLKR